MKERLKQLAEDNGFWFRQDFPGRQYLIGRRLKGGGYFECAISCFRLEDEGAPGCIEYVRDAFELANAGGGNLRKLASYWKATAIEHRSLAEARLGCMSRLEANNAALREKIEELRAEHGRGEGRAPREEPVSRIENVPSVTPSRTFFCQGEED